MTPRTRALVAAAMVVVLIAARVCFWVLVENRGASVSAEVPNQSTASVETWDGEPTNYASHLTPEEPLISNEAIAALEVPVAQREAERRYARAHEESGPYRAPLFQGSDHDYEVDRLRYRVQELEIRQREMEDRSNYKALTP